MSDERLRELRYRFDPPFRLSIHETTELLAALEAERAEYNEEWRSNIAFLERLDTLLGCDNHGSIGSQIVDKIQEWQAALTTGREQVQVLQAERAEVKRLLEALKR